MRKHILVLLAVPVAILVLAIGAATSPANRSLEARGGPGIQASGVLTFSGGEIGVICNVTLLRTISSVIPKINGTLMGKITGVAIAKETCRGITGIDDIIALYQSTERLAANSKCRIISGQIRLCDVTGGEARLWKLLYEGFGGALPEITSIRIRIERTQFKLDLGFPDLRCLYQGTVGTTVNVSGRVAREGVSDRTPIPLFRGLSFGCPDPGTLDGRFTLAPAITIALL